jgi:hypothetical protein
MKYKIQITPEGDKYIGYAIGEGGDVAFKTTPCRLATAASKELTKLIKYNTPQSTTQSVVRPNIIDSTLVKNLAQSQTPSTPPPSPRKCCGRG